MDLLTLLRELGALGLLLGLLIAALWAVKRFDLRLPGRLTRRTSRAGALRRLDLIERTSIDARRSVALIRRDGREHLILISPEGHVLVETAIVRDDVDRAAEQARVTQAETDRAESEAAAAATRAELEAAAERLRQQLVRTRRQLRERGAETLTRLRVQAGQARSFADLVAHGPTAAERMLAEKAS